jgi:hypothetical protein
MHQFLLYNYNFSRFQNAVRRTPNLKSDRVAICTCAWFKVHLAQSYLSFFPMFIMLKFCIHRPRDFKLNPIGNPIFNTFDVRTGTPYALSLMKMGMYQTATVFSGT